MGDGVVRATRYAEPVRLNGRLDAQIDELLARLAAALTGAGPALLPVRATGAEALIEAARLDQPVEPQTALLLPTSGSTGTPKLVELSADALLSSARATFARIGPPGRWLLALPLTHIAGWQVLVRGQLSEHPTPVVLDPSQSFSPDAFLDALEANPEIRYTALVPTQLSRLLDATDPLSQSPDQGRKLDRARDLTILLGGAAAPERLLQSARDHGLRVVTTYGSSETSGGCVYDGEPLDGVQVDRRPDGRLAIAGPTLASGYRGRPTDSAFETDPHGTRWFVTSDLADIDSTGHVNIQGRADDVIVTGGENVHPADVERVLSAIPEIADVVVVGVPDPEWGQQVVALIVTKNPSHFDPSKIEHINPTTWRHHAQELPSYAWPRRFIPVPRIPHLGIGKPDRAAAAALAAAAEK